MSFFSGLFGGAAAEPVAALGTALDGLFTSDDERLTHAEVMERLQQAPGAAQAAINQVEAGHASVFVAGWRPGIGWVCAASLALFFIPQFAMAAYVWLISCRQALEAAVIVQGALVVTLPEYPVTSSGLFELVMALLGMGTLRTIEKLSGKARS